MHPETKNGGDRKSEKIRIAKCNSDPVKPFIQDTAETLGVHPSTVSRQIQTAKNMTSEAKDIIRDADTKISKTDALKLSRLDPEQQKEAASLLAAGQIHSMKEYHIIPAEPTNGTPETEEPPEQSREMPELCREPTPEVPKQSDASLAGETGRFFTFAENVADLKNPNKDCSCTPDTFVAEFGAYMQRFIEGIAWYTTPDYSVVFSALSKVQINYLRELVVSICDTVNNIFYQIEGSRKK